MQQLAQLLAALAVSDVGDDDHDDVVTTDPSPDRPTTGVNGQSLLHRQTDWRSVSVWTLRKASCVSPSVCPVSPEKT